jgi:hypothetical protein
MTSQKRLGSFVASRAFCLVGFGSPYGSHGSSHSSVESKHGIEAPNFLKKLSASYDLLNDDE